MTDQQNFRLHIGGLGPSVTSSDLEKRFAAFGTVVKVDGVGKLDANGSPLKYAFVDILSTDPQIKRCMNLLSGTTYKGGTLRIAPARPDYVARVEREKANLPINTFVDPDEEAIRVREEKAAQKLERKLAKLRARKRGIEGYESSNMELMTVKKFKSRQGVNGWKKDPETSLPIFPILTRPLRPLPPLETAQSQTANLKEDASDCVRVPTRARRIRIDPTIYRAAIKNRKTHLLGPRAISIEQYKLGFSGGAKDVKKSQANRLLWECQLGEDGHAVWRLTNCGDVIQEERVALSSSTLQKLRDADEHPSSEPLPEQFTEHPLSSSTPALRLRGGASSKRPRRSQGQPESDIVAMNNEKITDHTEPDNVSPVRLSILTDMFKAKEAETTGFRLTDDLGGMELDDDVLGPSDETEMDGSPSAQDFQSEQLVDGQPLKSNTFIHPSRLKGSGFVKTQTAIHVKQGQRNGPFFFYPTDEDPDSKVINSLLSTEHREAARRHWLSGSIPSSSSDSWRTFVRTESVSEIETAHDKKKSTLTEQMRRKHKDAIKRDRKWGNKQAAKPSTLKGLESENDSSN
ncbi:hypothetical protein PGTUg99_005699 [Puccinia graminis f. sp. tritici]|uniref:RRM domain-containing protein n=2 Tax=Puccinia graminis f. sp. tritici TaxID=56615 RepID=H6QUC8_PUCGT|nr:uncharacterized protein PGTG_22380 [Puccinia graminis f. sp. tritici CRL 75-36-700-3]EHS64591.1 hypothetical protein PGTG_22380 [Puccinia graminis f. sp. tritici CRL 75-36-700-3]KAA1125044.1 hypothetical protein PGTUg99_005699 [Puccinia graminis f. sp. tritici]